MSLRTNITGVVFAPDVGNDEMKVLTRGRTPNIYFLGMFLSSAEHKFVHVMVLQLLTISRERNAR